MEKIERFNEKCYGTYGMKYYRVHLPMFMATRNPSKTYRLMKRCLKKQHGVYFKEGMIDVNNVYVEEVDAQTVNDAYKDLNGRCIMNYKETIDNLHKKNSENKKFVFDYYRNVVNKVDSDAYQTITATTDPDSEYFEFIGWPEYEDSDEFMGGEMSLAMVNAMDSLIEDGKFNRDKATIIFRD